MEQLEGVSIYPRIRREDGRGWLLKVFDGNDRLAGAGVQDCYVTVASPGMTRGGHYHLSTTEWFTVLAGEAEVTLEHVTSKVRILFSLDARVPCTLRVMSGIAHIFRNVGSTELMIAACADRPYDTADTVVYRFQ